MFIAFFILKKAYPGTNLSFFIMTEDDNFFGFAVGFMYKDKNRNLSLHASLWIGSMGIVRVER